MKEIEIGPSSKEALSWMIISEVLRQSALDLDIAVLHPGGGQYDTLSLVTFDGNAVVHVNRAGSSARVIGENIKNIFRTAAKSPSLAGKIITDKFQNDEQPPLSVNRRKRIELAVSIGNFLALNLSQKSFCKWGWTDSPYHVGASSIMSSFDIPSHWQDLNGSFKNTTWQSSVFLLFRNEKPFASVNFITGEIFDSKGKKLNKLITNQMDEGIARCHVGSRMTWIDSSGKVKFEDEVHVSDVRMTRRIYSEEYSVLPIEAPIYSFSCDEDESIIKWGTAERFLKPEDFLH